MHKVVLPFLKIRQPLFQHKISLSPNGKYVAYVVKETFTNNDNELPPGTSEHFQGCRLFVTEVDIGQSFEITDQLTRSWAPSWSEDSTKLAYYADTDGEVKLYIWEPSTNKTRQISNEAARGSFLPMDYPRWMNNDMIAFALLPEGEHLHLRTTKKQETKPNQQGRTVKQLYWKQKDQHDKNDETQSLAAEDLHYLYRIDVAIVDVNTGETNRLTKHRKARLVFPSPDGKYILYSAPASQPDITRFDGALEDLYCIDLQWTETDPILIAADLPTERNIRHDPSWSPSSNQVAYLKGLELHVYDMILAERLVIQLENLQKIDQRFLLWHPKGRGWIIKSRDHLYFVDIEGKIQPLKIPEGKVPKGLIRPSDGGFFHSSDGESCVLWSMDMNLGKSQIYRLPLNGGEPNLLYEDRDSLQGSTFQRTASWFSDVSADGSRIVIAAENIYQPLELYALNSNFNHKEKITSLNSEFKVTNKGKVNHLAWKDTRGIHRYGMLLLPEKDKQEKIPLVVHLYPNIKFSGFKNTWNIDVANAIVPPQWLVASGYAVFIPELYVQTEQFMEDVNRQLELALQAISSFSELDQNRMAVIGHSFGGFTVNCVITQTNRFKAAISCGGYSDLISAYSSYNSDHGQIDGFGCQWLETGQMSQGGPPWEAPEKYINNSPLFSLHQVQTPLMLIGGGTDQLYMPQGILVGLERLEKKVRCYIYEGEGHTPMNWSLENRIDVAEKVASWLEEHFS